MTERTVTVQDQERAEEDACDSAHLARTDINSALGSWDRVERIAYLEMARDNIENAILEAKRAYALHMLLQMGIK